MSVWTRLRGHRLNLGLGVLAFALVALVAWDRGRVTTAESEERRLELIDAWRSDDIASIAVETPRQQLTLTAERDDLEGRSWRMTVDGEPVPVDDQEVEALLTVLKYAGFERRVEGMSAAELGLDDPRAVLRIAMPPLSYAITVGGEAPRPPGGAYVEVEGGARETTRYVIDAELRKELSITPEALRSRQLAPYLSPEVAAFEIVHEGADFTLERGGWGGRTAGAFLVSTERATVRADHRVLDGWLTALGELEAQRFVAMPERGSEGATIAFRPRDEGEPEATLAFAGACEAPGTRRAIRRGIDPVAACAPADVVDRLLVDPVTLFDRHVVGTAAGDITDLRLEAGPKVVEIARKDKGWHMREPAEGPTDPEATEALLDDLVTATGERLSREQAADLEALGLDEPVAVAKLWGLPERMGSEKERVEVIEVGARDDDFIHLRRRDDGAVLRLPYELGRAFLPRPEALRSLEVLDLPLRAVEALDLRCGNPQKMTRSASGSWALESPEVPLKPDLSLANQLADQLRQLKALRWVSSRPDESHALSDPWCVVGMRVRREDAEEAETLTLELGAETRGGYFAQRTDEPGVFVAPRAMGLLASRWLLDRTALLVEESEVSEVVVEAPGAEPLEVHVSGGRWTAEARGLGIAVRDALTELVAEGVVGLGPAEPGRGFDEPRLTVTIHRAHETEPTVIVVGAGEVWRDTNVFFVRKRGLDATFAVAQARIRPLLDAL